MAESYIPPVAVAINARQALDVRISKPPSQRGMTPVGLARARQLANRQPVSVDTLRRMIAFFDRHEVDKQGSTWDKQGRGWQAWMGWGGDEGRRWAKEILATVGDDMTTKAMEYEGEFTIRQRMLASALVEVTHEVGKFNKGMGADGAHYVSAENNPLLHKVWSVRTVISISLMASVLSLMAILRNMQSVSFGLFPKPRLWKFRRNT